MAGMHVKPRLWKDGETPHTCVRTYVKGFVRSARVIFQPMNFKRGFFHREGNRTWSQYARQEDYVHNNYAFVVHSGTLRSIMQCPHRFRAVPI